MLKRLAVLLTMLAATTAHAQLRFQEGVHYHRIEGAPTAGVPAGRIEVAEVFSYVCSACYQASEHVAELKQKLPADVALTYVHAGFNTGWPLFQQAFVTAQQLGIVDATHERVFEGVWKTTQIPYFDRATGSLRKPPPTIEDLARFYAGTGAVSEAQFLAKAASAEVKAGVQRSEELVRAWQVTGTPTFVVNGRYRIDNKQLASWDDMGALVNYLAGLERSRLRKP